MNISINKDQRLYVISCGEGYSCLGFDVAFEKAYKIYTELKELSKKHGNIAGIGEEPRKEHIGASKGYEDYRTMIDLAHIWNTRTGHRFRSELTPQLIGLEGKQVEVTTKYDEKRRFWVGKSTGWIPCHLEIKTRNSSGGGCADKEYKSVMVVK